VINQPQQ